MDRQTGNSDEYSKNFPPIFIMQMATKRRVGKGNLKAGRQIQSAIWNPPRAFGTWLDCDCCCDCCCCCWLADAEALCA